MIEAPNRVPTWAILTVLAAISAGAYFNTIQAGFTYDDFFAVVGPKRASDLSLTQFLSTVNIMFIRFAASEVSILFVSCIGFFAAALK